MPVVVITGASAGIGRATARAFAERGYDVALLARGEAGLAGAVADVEAAGRKALACPTDVGRFEQVDAAADQIEEALGEIDVWVNDAMTTVFAPSWEVAPADFARAVEVTFLGQVWGTTAALTRMRRRNRGTIVNVGSALAYIGIPLQSAYCASKFACRGYFESVRAELIHERSAIHLGMVHMPAVNTPQFDWCQTSLDHHPQPVPPIYQPEICARAIVAAALDHRRTKVVGSWNKFLVGMSSVLPGVANQYAARGAWETQLTSQRIDPDRPHNLRTPQDGEVDQGAHGIFDAKARGFWDPSFLATLPTSAKTFALAVLAEGRGKAERYAAQARRSGRVDAGGGQ